jgi:hypothetical protein
MINQSPQQSIYKLLQGSTVTTIIDVGANVGQFGLDLMAKSFHMNLDKNLLVYYVRLQEIVSPGKFRK